MVAGTQNRSAPSGPRIVEGDKGHTKTRSLTFSVAFGVWIPPCARLRSGRSTGFRGSTCGAVPSGLYTQSESHYPRRIVSRRQCRHANGGGQDKPGLPPFSFLRPAPELEGLAVPASPKGKLQSAYVGKRATTRSTAAIRLRLNSSCIVIAEKPGHSFHLSQRETRHILLRLHARPCGRDERN